MLMLTQTSKHVSIQPPPSRAHQLLLPPGLAAVAKVSCYPPEIKMAAGVDGGVRVARAVNVTFSGGR
ncbi:hypothetical protein C0Q70_13506 [Pomacea canaliculata]|uniref:Uncharacterized protein n=1 Tax=Pomacea canaliculata TaxID=400727 RepID=A0A2T7NXH1_POMCA|nr:hypothetical protein C0Q70_13506 [Pomacea canaliculata]